MKSKKIIKNFKPDAVVGVGGYASGPVVYVASKRGVPAVLQEQNSYAGVTNKILAKHAKKICVAYDNMEKFFPSGKIVKTGNPIRKDLYNSNIDKNSAFDFFKLDKSKKVILILGGSGGARTINEAVINKLDEIKSSGLQLLWQTGKFYHKQSLETIKDYEGTNVKIHDFINRMDYAFAVADIVISRAGAGTISELCLVKKPSILVPSPNVAEDHQTKNAMALVEKEAAILVKDLEARGILVLKAIELSKDDSLMQKLSNNISNLAINNSDELIANEIFKLIDKK